jgi:hypothetical protein
LYEDYQCPNCKETEDTYGPVLKQLAASGDIKLQYRTLTFLDNGRNDSSYRAAMAAASADMVGKLEAYHNMIYKNQPAREGDGYTDDQLRNVFAKDAGITGSDLTNFQKYYDTKATSAFVKNAAAKGLTARRKTRRGRPIRLPAKRLLRHAPTFHRQREGVHRLAVHQRSDRREHAGLHQGCSLTEAALAVLPLKVEVPGGAD